MGKEERGKGGGVVGFLSLAGLLPAKGEGMKELLATGEDGGEGGEWPPWMRVERVGGMVDERETETECDETADADEQTGNTYLTLLSPQIFLHNDLPPMSANHWSEHTVTFLTPPNADDILCTTSTPAWKSLATGYILCAADALLPVEKQRWMARRAGAKMVVRVDGAGHDAFLAREEEVVRAIGGFVGSVYGVPIENDDGDDEGVVGDETFVDAVGEKKGEEKGGDDESAKPLRRRTTAP